jgi:hypothetical protein
MIGKIPKINTTEAIKNHHRACFSCSFVLLSENIIAIKTEIPINAETIL